MYISFYNSVNTVNINHFLHFIDSCLNREIGFGVSVKHIDWDRVIRNSKRTSSIYENGDTGKLIGHTPGGKPLLQICLENED